MSSQDQDTANQTVDTLLDERNATHNIFDTAAADGRFNELIQVLRGASSEYLLMDPELITVFAPTDDALNQVGTDTLVRLLHPETRPQLVAILRHHIMHGAISAADLASQQHVKLIDGSTVPIARNEAGDLTIGGVRIAQYDISCTNGMLHVLDGLLRPDKVS